MTQNDSVKNSKLFVIIAVINTTRYRLLVGGETICPADGSSTVAYRFAANQSINQSFLIHATRPITDTHDTNDLQTTNIKKKKETTKLLTTGHQYLIIIPAKAFARDYVITGVRLSVCLSVCLFVCYHDN